MVVVGLVGRKRMVYTADDTVHVVGLDDLASIGHLLWTLPYLRTTLDGTLLLLFFIGLIVICLTGHVDELLDVLLLVLAGEDLPTSDRVSIH